MSNYTIDKSEASEWVNEQCQPKIGAIVQPDGWNTPSCLIDCNDWDKADFRLPGNYVDSAVKVSLSTRSQKIYATSSAYKLRVQIIFVGDCEADIVVHGWMWV